MEAKENIEKLSTPLYENGIYSNPKDWSFTQKKLSDLLQWIFSRKRAKFPDLKIIEEKLPLLKPDKQQLLDFHEKNNNENNHKIQSTWIGHSTFLIQMEGCNILTDPVFYQRCSPIPFMGPKRYRNPSIELEDLPPINAVIVSHDHYDHLDINAIKYFAQHSPDTKYYVCMGMKDWFHNCGVPKDNIFELSWWESAEYSPQLKMICTPCQHWTKRTLTNTNKALWGSWTIKGEYNNVYFAGDTGYCPGFKEIGNKYGPFDLAFIPIGAYCPRWFMKCAHINPKEAVKIHKDLKCKKSIGMHWGTFVLTDEDIFEPPIKLEEAKEKLNVANNEFITVFHGETKIWLHGNDVTNIKE